MIRRFARPYSKAIMEAAGSPEKANALRGELMRFEAALQTSPELRDVYANPGISAETKKAITDRLVSKMKLSELAGRAIDVVVRNNRVNDLGAILESLTASVNDALGVAVAKVRTAKTLSPDEMAELAAVLGKKVGRKVELDVVTDPKLLGGFVARIGSEVYDASISGKINKFRESLR
ncbi:MAG: ATP synthase F1 subunit delta [Thermoanaerobaculia bacterium]